jgi:hypothetical protein
MVYGMMRAAKYSETPSARARTCVMVGDNYVENKCNVDLDFCTEVVQRGWYDEVQLLYGYPQRTHSHTYSIQHTAI